MKTCLLILQFGIVIKRNMWTLPQLIHSNKQNWRMFAGGKPVRDHEPFVGERPAGWSGCLHWVGGVMVIEFFCILETMGP